jgi:glycerol kinase
MTGHVLVVDQGTTSTRSIVFGPDAALVTIAQEEFPQIFPEPGWVEHDPESLWRTTLSTARQALSRAGVEPNALAGVGITNQRETTLVWSRTTGRPIYNAIVWQDRRTASLCAELKDRGSEKLVSARAGLLLDPYFSATKIAWILDNVPGARAEAERGDLAFGTVDSFLVRRLTNGKVHVTDATNASRTLLFNRLRGWLSGGLASGPLPRSRAVREDLAAADELHAFDGAKRMRISLSRLARRHRPHDSAAGDLAYADRVSHEASGRLLVASAGVDDTSQHSIVS